jgi:hypothetical protein
MDREEGAPSPTEHSEMIEAACPLVWPQFRRLDGSPPLRLAFLSRVCSTVGTNFADKRRSLGRYSSQNGALAREAVKWAYGWRAGREAGDRKSPLFVLDA